jgi:hypothetical protein
MRKLTAAGLTVLLATIVLGARQAPYRTLDDKFAPPAFTDVTQWNTRAAYLREHILASAGLLPMPARAPLAAQIFGEVKRSDYTVSKLERVHRPPILPRLDLVQGHRMHPHPSRRSPFCHPPNTLRHTPTHLPGTPKPPRP